MTKDYDDNNVFAKIIRGEIPAHKVYEDDFILSFHDAHPVAPLHVLVIPKGPYIDYSDFIDRASADEIAAFFKKIREIAVDVLGVDEEGYRLCMNKGPNSGQTVFHFHAHIISGSKFSGLFSTREG